MALDQGQANYIQPTGEIVLQLYGLQGRNDFYILRLLFKHQKKEEECAVEMDMDCRASGSWSLPPFSRPSANELRNGSPVLLPIALLCKTIHVYFSGGNILYI